MLILDLLDRALSGGAPAACFAAAYALAEQFDLVSAEPDLPTGFFPEQGTAQAAVLSGGALAGFPPGCYVDPQPALEPTPAWALDRMHVPAAWAYSEQSGRPSRGKDVIVAQPDTGITAHVELVGVAFVPGFDVIDDDNDPTDPLTGPGQPGARHGNRKRPGVAGQLRRHRLGPSGAADADPHHRERGADQADHGRPRDRLGDPRRSTRRHHEPGRHPRQRLTPRDKASGRGRPDRPGRCRELRAPGRVAGSVRRMHRRRSHERSRRTLARHLPRRTRRHLGTGPKRLPRGRAPRWTHCRRHGRPGAGHELRGRPHRGSGGNVACSPRASQRGRRCTCPWRNGSGDVPPIAAGHGTPADPMGRRMPWAWDRGCAGTPRGELRRGSGRVAADLQTNARPAPPRASPPW